MGVISVMLCPIFIHELKGLSLFRGGEVIWHGRCEQLVHKVVFKTLPGLEPGLLPGFFASARISENLGSRGRSTDRPRKLQQRAARLNQISNEFPGGTKKIWSGRADAKGARKTRPLWLSTRNFKRICSCRSHGDPFYKEPVLF
jgi:hypothetical protein